MGNASKEEREKTYNGKDEDLNRRRSRESVNSHRHSRRKSASVSSGSHPGSAPGSPKSRAKHDKQSEVRHEQGHGALHTMGDALAASSAGNVVKKYFSELDHSGETKFRHAKCIVDKLMDEMGFNAREVVGWVLPEMRELMGEGEGPSRGWKEKRSEEERGKVEEVVKGERSLMAGVGGDIC